MAQRSSPKARTCPASGRKSAASIARSVDYPLPLGPIKRCISPARSSKDASSTAIVFASSEPKERNNPMPSSVGPVALSTVGATTSAGEPSDGDERENNRVIRHIAWNAPASWWTEFAVGRKDRDRVMKVNGNGSVQISY